MDKVVIGIPTFKRPVGLKRLLLSIENIDLSNTDTVILVADNEGDNGKGIAVVRDELQNYNLEIQTVGVAEQGISNVRNSIIDVSFNRLGCKYLAMVDDDEVVDRYWLKELIKSQKANNSDVVSAMVLPHFEVSPPTWAQNLPLYWRKSYDSGVIDLVDCTTSVLLFESVINKYDIIKFNTEYGLTGGGDKEYFTRLKSLGAVFSFARESVSYEFFGKSRLTETWAIERSLRIGSADMRIIRKNSNIFYLLLYIAKACVALVLSSVKFLVSTNSDYRFICKLSIYRQLGKFNGLLMKNYRNVYSKIHGK